MLSAKDISAMLPDLSAVRVRQMKGVVGTDKYMAPEVLWNKPYNPFAADIYSLGVILFIMATGFAPYKVAEMLNTAYKHLSNHGARGLIAAYHLEGKVPEALVELIGDMMSFTESARPSIKQVIARLHAFLGIDA